MSRAEPSRRITVVVYDEGAHGASQLGGGQIARINLLAALDKGVFRPVLLTSREGDLVAAARARGVEVVVRDINAGCPRVQRRDLVRRPLAIARTAWAVLRAGRRLARALDDLGADVLHPNENLSRTVALVARAWRRTPAVIHIDNEWNQGPADRIMRFLFLRGFDRLIAVSARVIEAADPGGRFRGRIALVPTGLEPSRFAGHDRAAARRAMGAEAGEVVVLTVGRLERLKGQASGLDAMAILGDRHGIAARYVLAGEGPDRAVLRERAAALGLEDRVVFLGHRTDIPSLLAGADVLLHPSLTEAHPLVVVEALMAGLPVVATDVGGTAAILDGGRFGRLVGVGDAAAMAGAIARLSSLAGEERRSIGAVGRDHAVARFSEQEMVRRIAGIYQDLAR